MHPCYNMHHWGLVVYVLCFLQYSSSASISETEIGSTQGALEGSHGILVLELLKRVKLLEERARLVETVSLNQQSQFESLYRLIDRQEALQGQINDSMTGYGNQNTKVTSVPQSVVAFTAYLNTTIERPFSGQTVVFNNVLLNEGNGYNTLTGVFLAPRDGVYDFFFSTFNGRPDKTTLLKLMVQDTAVMYSMLQNASGNWKQSSSRVFVGLQRGDAVRVAFGGGNFVYGDSTYRVTSFSGTLIS